MNNHPATQFPAVDSFFWTFHEDDLVYPFSDALSDEAINSEKIRVVYGVGSARSLLLKRHPNQGFVVEGDKYAYIVISTWYSPRFSVFKTTDPNHKFDEFKLQVRLSAPF